MENPNAVSPFRILPLLELTLSLVDTFSLLRCRAVKKDWEKIIVKLVRLHDYYPQAVSIKHSYLNDLPQLFVCS